MYIERQGQGCDSYSRQTPRALPGQALIDHSTPAAPAFEVPENVEFYQTYVNLFRNGVFRCARNEAGDSPYDRVTRVYFSGAIDFRSITSRLRVIR